MLVVTRIVKARNEVGQKYGGEGGVTPTLENLPFRRSKTAVQCISSGQLTGGREI